MSVECRECRTKLMGDVNRCWNCGTVIPASLLTQLIEPESEVAEADGMEDANGGEDSPAPGVGEATVVDTVIVAEAVSAPSDLMASQQTPFAEPRVGNIHATAPPAAYPAKLANVAGASVSLVLGGAALLEASWFPLGGICTAIVGLLCGLWGIQSNRRISSTLGMVMCTAALLWSGTNFAINLYIDKTNVNPFAPNAPIEEDSAEEDLQI